MKKLSFILFSLLAVTLFTACDNDDKTENKQTFTAPINCRAIDGDQVVYSQGNMKAEINYTDMVLKFTTDYKDVDGMPHTLTTPDMKLTSQNSSTVYNFSATGSGVESLNGSIDMGTGMLWYQFNEGGTKVVCTSQLLYAYTNTDLTNLDNGNHGYHSQSAYLFALDNRGETCVLRISNFMSTLNGTVDVAEVQYDGLTVTPTTTGYKITADMVESNYKGFYTLTEVDFTVYDDCLSVEGTFMCNGIKFIVNGGLFKYN